MATPESGGKTWRKKIGRPVVPVHSTVMIPAMRNIIMSRQGTMAERT